jgi:hypothetical protein
MTEQQIEAWTARQTDALDRRYMTSEMTEETYKARLAAIDRAAAGMARGERFYTALSAEG